MILEPAQLSAKALARCKNPQRRGAFQAIDAARRQLALLSVTESSGSARIFWLVSLQDQRIEDARFLAFGDLSSHPIADAFSELVRGKTVTEACALPLESVEVLLRDDPGTPIFADLAPLQFLAEIQINALAEIPNLTLLPPPTEKPLYKRRREADWTAQDRAWLPLSLLKKIALVERTVKAALSERLGQQTCPFSLEGLHDDFALRLKFPSLPPEDRSTVLAILEGHLQGAIHPEIRVEDAQGTQR